MCKKIIALFATVILIFNVIFPKIAKASDSAFSDGSSYGEATKASDMQVESQDKAMSIVDGGSSQIGSGGSSSWNVPDDSSSSLVKNLIKIFNIVPSGVRLLLSILTYDDDSSYVDDVKYGEAFSIEKTVFGKIRMFDVNFLYRYANEDPLSGAIKDQVAKYFYITRNISIGLMLLLLLYTGIRMAMTTIASDIAKYKTMIKDWVVSIIILFTLQYFMSAVLWVGNQAMGICETVMTEMITDDDEYKIEESLFEQATQSTSKGWSLVIPTILYWLLTYYQVKFFLMYMRRLGMMAFLVTIAPFITVSYALDKAGDGQAQALKTWLSEFAMGTLIQPLHAFSYMIFMLIASKIMVQAPILAIIFINYLGKAEKTVRGIFRIEKGIMTKGMNEAGNSMKKLGK